MRAHKIKLRPDWLLSPMAQQQIRFLEVHSQGRIATYNVSLGRFIINVVVLHIAQNAPPAKEIAKGGSGKVIPESIAAR